MRSEKEIAPELFDFMEKIGALFKRPAGTAWGYDELAYLSEIVTQSKTIQADFTSIEKLYATQDKTKLPRSVRTLLQNWSSTCDRARNPENEKQSGSAYQPTVSRNEGTHNDGDMSKYRGAVERNLRNAVAQAEDLRRSRAKSAGKDD